MGQIVHYTSDEARCRPAIVVETRTSSSEITLAIFHPQRLDFEIVSEVPRNEDATDKGVGSWHYPDIAFDLDNKLPDEPTNPVPLPEVFLG